MPNLSFAETDQKNSPIICDDAIVRVHRSGIIESWDDNAVQMFGFAAEEAIGKSLDLIIPEKLRERHWKGWSYVVEQGVTGFNSDRTLTVPALRRNGSQIVVIFNMDIIRNHSGNIDAIKVVFRDIRKQP